jgi:hypothetical protein
MRLAFASVLSCAAAAFTAAPALACSFAPPTAFELHDDASDTTPPAAPKGRIGKLKRGVEGDSEGCGGGSGTSCDDIGSVDIDLRGLEADTGVVLTFKGAPEGLVEPVGPVSPDQDRVLSLHWIDGGGDTDLDFSIEIWSVDRAGNMSETPTRLRVNDGGGCSTGGRRAPGAWLGLLGIALLVRSVLARRIARLDATRQRA